MESWRLDPGGRRWKSARLSDEQAALRRVATLTAQSAPPSSAFEAVTREVGTLSGADLARMERYETDGTVTGVAAWLVPDRLAVGTRFALDGSSIARDVRRAGGPRRPESFAGETGAIAREAYAVGIRSWIGCPITVAGRRRAMRPRPTAMSRFGQTLSHRLRGSRTRRDRCGKRRVRKSCAGSRREAALRRVATPSPAGQSPLPCSKR